MATHDVENRAYRHQWERAAPAHRQTYHWRFVDAFRNETDRTIDYGVKIMRLTICWTSTKPSGTNPQIRT